MKSRDFSPGLEMRQSGRSQPFGLTRLAAMRKWNASTLSRVSAAVEHAFCSLRLVRSSV